MDVDSKILIRDHDILATKYPYYCVILDKNANHDNINDWCDDQFGRLAWTCSYAYKQPKPGRPVVYNGMAYWFITPEDCVQFKIVWLY